MKKILYYLIVLLGAALLLAPNGLLAQNAKPPTQLTYQGFLTDVVRYRDESLRKFRMFQRQREQDGIQAGFEG